MRAILEIMQDASEGSENPAPSAVYGQNNRLARQLRTAARMVMRDLIDNGSGNHWPQMHSTWVFRLQPGQFSYPLPPDFRTFIPMTEVRESRPVGVVGPISPQRWALWRAGYRVAPAEYSWRVRSGRVEIEPVPQTAEVVTIDYLSSFAALSKITGWDNQLWEGSPGDRAKAPFVTREGYLSVTAADLGMTEEAFDAKYRLQAAPGGWDASNDTDGDGWDNAFVRKYDFTLDTDYPALDEQLVEIGITWRMRRANGLPYAQEQGDFERMRSSLLGVAPGHAGDFLAGHCDDGPTRLYPDDFIAGDFS